MDGMGWIPNLASIQISINQGTYYVPRDLKTLEDKKIQEEDRENKENMHAHGPSRSKAYVRPRERIEKRLHY